MLCVIPAGNPVTLAVLAPSKSSKTIGVIVSPSQMAKLVVPLVTEILGSGLTVMVPCSI
jgi:hypothetical protein